MYACTHGPLTNQVGKPTKICTVQNLRGILLTLRYTEGNEMQVWLGTACSSNKVRTIYQDCKWW
jgi:hypothetical protein